MGLTELPTGTVTFLFTDLERSTHLWEQQRDGMQRALARHDALLRAAVESHGGQVVKTTGDGLHAVFALATDAVGAAVAAQRSLAAEPWRAVSPLRVRMGLHSGAAELRTNDYFGPALNRAARLMALGHGGQVLCSQATAHLVRDSLPDGVDLLDLGSHALRDITRPEEVFQITHPDLERDFPPLRGPDSVVGNLPPPRTQFVGRHDDLSRLEKLIDRARLVTLTGVGGVGKTRLAIQAGLSLMPRYDDGVWFVDLGPVDDATLVAAAVATSMRLPDRRQGSPEDAILAAARDWQALMILDNCEHVIDAAAGLAELVTDACPGVVIVATSREALGIEGEQVVAVGPLPVPPSHGGSPSGEVFENESVRLFAERATAARAGFELTDDNARAVADVCRRLDGIPLAIELAAARVGSMSPASILERLDERFRLLSQGRRTALARHQTLRAAVDWSYDLLSPAERLTFARLSVFAGSFTLDAAEAVASDDGADSLDVLDALGGLVAKSMVLLDEHAATVRYRVLETMREYAADRLEELDRPDRVADRYARYYVELGEQAAPHIVGVGDSQWTPRLEAEQDNLHAALTWLRDRDPARLTRLAHALAQFWRRQRKYQAALGWMRAALERDPAMPLGVRAELAAFCAYSAINVSQLQLADEVLQQSLEASRAAGEDPNPHALTALALRALVTNRPDDARGYAEQALARARAVRQPHVEGECLASASITMSMVGEDARGVELADAAMELVRPLGNDFLLSIALEAGGLARYRSDPVAAIALLDESMLVTNAYSIAIRDQAVFFKGIAHASLREYAAAAEAFDNALAVHHAAGAEYYRSMVLAGIAGLLARTGSAAAAIELLGSLERFRDDRPIIGAPRDLAMQARLRDRLQQAVEPDRFAALWATGRRLSVDDTVSLARRELSQLSA
jgi:predicted ATPase/class 3 adenylate cyclase